MIIIIIKITVYKFDIFNRAEYLTLLKLLFDKVVRTNMLKLQYKVFIIL